MQYSHLQITLAQISSQCNTMGA